jgi:cyanophycin synthetase
VLVINYKFVAAAIRKPASVVGDGISNIQELIDKTNEDPRRGYGHEKTLTQIKVDDFTLDMLAKANLNLESILPNGKELLLKPTANLSTGGTATDVTDLVHPDNIFMCERIARIIGLDICGIDIMAENLTEPVKDIGGAILEVNAAPGFRMHIDPAEGIPRNVAEPVIDMLYPKGSSARIPIIAVTGTNGKTTTTRLMAHMVKTMGYKVGYTTTDGIYIQNQLMLRGDCTGPVSAEFVLKDPAIDFAVLETARGGILRAGLGFHNCDIAIVTNIAEDHLGLQDIDTIEQLTRVKAVVPASVLPDGYAILNADNKYAVSMAKECVCKIAYFSMDENNSIIKEHINKGGLAAVYENGYVTICKGTWKIRIEKAVNIPLTFGGRATYNIANVLPTLLAGFIRNFKIEDMRVALQTFIPGPAQTPGRMNIFRFKNFELMVDYAHNTSGFEAIGEMLSKIDANHVGVIAGVGDRRDEDTIGLGRQAAKMFDEIVIRQDKNLRGRTEDEIIELIKRGIREVDPNKKVTSFKRESDAIDFAIKNARKGTFLTICSDVVPAALDQILALKEAEDKGEVELGK